MKKSKIMTTVLCVLFLVGFVFAGQHLFIADDANEDIVDKGVYIGGIDIGGMSAQEATDAFNAYIEELRAEKITLIGPKGNIELTLDDMGLTANVEAVVRKATGTAKASNLITRFMLLKDLEGDNIVIDMGLSIDKQATANLIHNQSNKLNIEAVDWDLKRSNDKFTIVEGKAGEAVDIVASVNALSDYIAKEWQNGVLKDVQFTLDSHVVNPRGSEEELSLVKDLMGSFSTSYKSSGSNRAKNVENGCSKINGTLLYPGDTLSAYALTSPFTIKNGYREAASYANGETVTSVGGGICQVSTTLYNAAIRAELKITQRNAHSMTVSYVKLSEDAAIAGTYKDLRFRNDYDYPIYVEGVCKNKTITFNIYGHETRDPNRTIRFESETISEDNPPTQYTLSSSQDVGYYKVTRSAHIGYKAKLWKIVTVNGVDTEKIQMNQSNYSSSCQKVTIGTKGATAEQLATIKAALETKDDAYIKQVVSGINTPATPTPTPETTPSETPGENPSGTPESGTGDSQTPTQEPTEPEEPNEPAAPSEQV